MLITALVLFILAAAGGMYLLSFILRDKQLPGKIAIIHGLVAATGVILLVVYTFYHESAPVLSLVLFIIAALGGVTMGYKGMTGKPGPAWMALGHGTLAIIAVATLVVYILV